jgi:vitamin B12 transporter
MSDSQPLFAGGRSRASSWILALCLGLTGFSAARAEDQPAATTTVSQLVVSANRVPTPADQVASSVTLITAEQIEAQQDRSLPDILREVPGVNLVQSGGPGGATSLFIRGANSNQTKVLVDGIDVSDPTTPNGVFQFQNFLSAGVQQIEVLRGPQSGLYGSDAIGGVVEVITKTGSGPARITASLEGGSFGTFNQTASLSGSLDRFSYALDLAHLRATDTPVTSPELLAPGEASHDDAYENLTVATKLGYRLTDQFDLGLVARYVHSDLRFTNDSFSLDTYTYQANPEQSRSVADQAFTRATAHLSLFDGRFDQTLGFGFTDYRREDLDPVYAASSNTGDRYKLDWRGDAKLARGEILTLGAEWQQDEILNSPITARMSDAAGYAELRSEVGGRFFNTLSLRYDASDRFGDAATFRIAPSLAVAETGTTLKASVGTGFKAPTLNELFVDYPGYAANPNLRPERSLGYDVGFEQALAHRVVVFGATWFHNDIKDLIAANDTFTTSVNIGKATTTGVETFLAWRPTANFSARADYTYTDAQDAILHQELVRRPRDKVSLTFGWRPIPKLSLTASVLYVGPWQDFSRVDYSSVTASDYATVNLAATYEMSKDLSVFARITNLLDRRYQDPIGFLQPGLGVIAGAKASF